MNRLTLRQASPNDREFAYCVKRAAFKEYVEKVWGWDEAEQQQLHEQRFGTQDFRVVNLAGTDVGIMAVVMGPDCVHVNQLFLLPEHQGKDIGRRCMWLVMEEARRLGLPVRLRVMKVNPRALAFYQRLGFLRTGERERAAYRGGHQEAGRGLSGLDLLVVTSDPTHGDRRHW